MRRRYLAMDPAAYAGLGVTLGVGVFFGLYPARKAADMNIVDSLSYE